MPAKAANGRRNGRGIRSWISRTFRSLSMRRAVNTFAVMSSSCSRLSRLSGELSVQGVQAVATAQVGEEEAAARSQHPIHLGEERVHRRVAVGGLDVDDRVEGVVRKGHGLGVAAGEDQAGRFPMAVAEVDRLRGEIEAR